MIWRLMKSLIVAFVFLVFLIGCGLWWLFVDHKIFAHGVGLADGWQCIKNGSLL